MINKLSKFLASIFPIFPFLIIGIIVWLMSYRPNIPIIEEVPANVSNITPINNDWYAVEVKNTKGEKKVFIISAANALKWIASSNYIKS